MPLTKLTIDNIGELDDGIARGAVNKALDNMIRDLEDRGERDEEKRTVLIEVNGQIVERVLTIWVEVSTKAPKYKTGRTVGEMRMDSEARKFVIEFRGDSPDNPHQQTIDDAPRNE